MRNPFHGASRTAIAIAASLVVFQVGDIVSTEVVLGTHNAIEGNPIMAFLIGRFGEFWWLPKLALVVLIALYILSIRVEPHFTTFQKLHLGFRVALFAIAGYVPVIINFMQYYAYLNGYYG